MTPTEKYALTLLIQKNLYEICLKAAKDMGDDIYKLSCYGKNHK